MQQGDHTSTTPHYHNYPQNPNPNPITTDLHHPPVTYASANTTSYHPPTSEYYPPYPQQNPDPLPRTATSYDSPPPNPNPQPSIFPKVEASHTPYRSQQPYNPPYDLHQTHPTYPSPPASSIPHNRIPLNHSSSIQYSSSLYNNAPSVPSQVPGPVHESPYETDYDGNYGRSSSDLRAAGGSVDYHGKRPDVGMSMFESSGGYEGDGYGEGVYAYQGGEIVNAERREGVKGGVQKFRVKLLAESGSQSTMDVLCQIGLDDIRILDPSTSQTLRIYPLDTVTRCEVYYSSTVVFWSKSSLDIEPRRTRLHSNSYTTNILFDTVTAAINQVTAATNQMTNSNVSTHQTLSLRSILEKEKLSGLNFLDWFRNVRIVLRTEKKDYVLDRPISDEPPANASKAIKDTWVRHKDDSNEVACIMLACMVPELQKTFEFHTAFDMIEQLKLMFQVQAKQERFATMTAFIGCKMTEGSSVSAHVLKMKAYVEQLSRLGFSIRDELAIDVILDSLPKSFSQFVLNYNNNNEEKSISELHSMLKTAEANIKKSRTQVLMVREGKITKNVKTGIVTGKGKAFEKGKEKGKVKGKAPASKPIAKPKPHADADCFHCNQKGHWKRNCPLYLEEVKKNKANAIGTSRIKEEC